MSLSAVPYTQNELAFRHPDRVDFPSPANHRVGGLEEYDVRQSVELTAPSHEDALAQCWELYQNIDSAWLTPDGGRSMMTGDLVLLTSDKGIESWWICCSFGWHQTEAPHDYEARLALSV